MLNNFNKRSLENAFGENQVQAALKKLKTNEMVPIDPVIQQAPPPEPIDTPIVTNIPISQNVGTVVELPQQQNSSLVHDFQPPLPQQHPSIMQQQNIEVIPPEEVLSQNPVENSNAGVANHENPQQTIESAEDALPRMNLAQSFAFITENDPEYPKEDSIIHQTEQPQFTPEVQINAENQRMMTVFDPVVQEVVQEVIQTETIDKSMEQIAIPVFESFIQTTPNNSGNIITQGVLQSPSERARCEGKCTRCFAPYYDEKYKTCDKCRDYDKSRREKKKENVKALLDSFVSTVENEKMCRLCFQTFIDPKLSTCENCRTLRQKYGKTAQAKKTETFQSFQPSVENEKLCTRCSEPFVHEKYNSCEKCRIKSNEKRSQKLEDMAKQEQKICTKCLKRPVEGKFKTCLSCRTADYDRLKKSKKSAFENFVPSTEDEKLCTKCFTKFNDEKFKTCEKCREKNKKFTTKKKEQSKNFEPSKENEKVCSSCWCIFVHEKYKTCEKCRNSAKNSSKTSYQKRKQLMFYNQNIAIPITQQPPAPEEIHPSMVQENVDLIQNENTNNVVNSNEDSTNVVLPSFTAPNSIVQPVSLQEL